MARGERSRRRSSTDELVCPEIRLLLEKITDARQQHSDLLTKREALNTELHQIERRADASADDIRRNDERMALEGVASEAETLEELELARLTRQIRIVRAGISSLAVQLQQSDARIDQLTKDGESAWDAVGMRALNDLHLQYLNAALVVKDLLCQRAAWLYFFGDSRYRERVSWPHHSGYLRNIETGILMFNVGEITGDPAQWTPAAIALRGAISALRLQIDVAEGRGVVPSVVAPIAGELQDGGGAEAGEENDGPIDDEDPGDAQEEDFEDGSDGGGAEAGEENDGPIDDGPGDAQEEDE
jgi:hypothetical protein